MPSARAEAQRLMDLVIEHLMEIGDELPQDLLVNSVLAITIDGAIQIKSLP